MHLKIHVSRIAHDSLYIIAMVLTQGSSHSSDYFDDDPEFLKAINEVAIPGDAGPSPTNASPTKPAPTDFELNPFQDADQLPPLTQRALKRQRSPDDDLYADEEEGAQYHGVLNAVDGNDKGDDESYLQSFTYGASRFGEFGEYMARKRAKLQIQNTEMNNGSDDKQDSIREDHVFSGLQIYVGFAIFITFCP